MTITAPDGAYIIGGGEYHFGQAMTEDLARAAFEFPVPTLGNMIELLRSVLEMLPLDALAPFKDFLGLDDAHFGTVVDAVNGIISSLQQRPVFMLLTDFTSWVKDLVQAITGVAGGGDLSMLTTWFQSNVIDQIANIGAQLQNVLGVIVNFVTKNDLALAIKNFITSIDLAAAIKNVISDIVKVFTGTAGALSDLTSWVSGVLNPVLSGFQLLLDSLFSLFGGTAGSDKSVAETINAISGWFSGVFQKLIDGINALASLIPGFSAGSNPIQNAVDIISGILGIGQSAAASAAQANLGVAAIVAGQNGGGHDDFDYPLSASLPSPWVSTYSGNAPSTLGPDGRGYLMWKISGLVNTYREVHYRKSDVTMPNSDCTITVVLSKAPGYGSTDHSKLWIEVLWSATNESRLRVQIGPNYAQLQSVSATGTVTNVGAKHTIPNVQNGDAFALKIRSNDVSLMTGTITHFTETVAVGSFTGRQFGFGSMYAGTLLTAPVGAELTGITWQN